MQEELSRRSNVMIVDLNFQKLFDWKSTNKKEPVALGSVTCVDSFRIELLI